ncbi:MAG: hypothetical protein KY437_07200 [Actinobacteria bacterium]|nr:hypothetical protein [Actinomycetota bacterium]
MTGLLVGALLLVAAPALAGGGGGGSACLATSSGPEMTMLDSCFEGIAHELEAGTTLTVTNRGHLPHTITAADGSFDSGTLGPGEAFEVTVDEAGNVPIYCTLHGTKDGQGMAGVLMVGGAADAELASTSSSAPPSSTGPGSAAGVAVAGLIGLAIGMVVERRRAGRARREVEAY